MLPSILFFLVLIIPPFFLSVCYEKRFEETIPISSGIIVLTMFFCGILGWLKHSVYIILGIILVLTCFSIFALIRKNGFHKLHLFFTPAFLAFFVVYIFLLYAHYKRLVHEWDEFSHWGDVVKAMVYIDDFATNPNSHSLFQSYVPGMALFQYLFQKIAMLFPHGQFFDWRLYFCFHLFAFINLLPFFSTQRWKTFLPVFILIGCVAIIPSFLQTGYLTSIYIDSFVGLLAGVGFALLFVKRMTRTTIIHLLVICSLLVLSKDVGLLFAIAIGVAFIIQEIWSNKEKKRTISFCILTIAAILIPKVLWEINISINHASVKFRNPISLNVLLRVITHQDKSYLTTVFYSYFRKLFTTTIPLEGGTGISITYPLLFVILIALIFYSKKAYSKIAPDRTKQQSVASWGAMVVAILYLIGMPVVYMFRFGQYEAEQLASFDRYLSIVYDCLIILVFVLFIYFIQEKPQLIKRGLVIFIIVTLITLNPGMVISFINRQSVKESQAAWKPYESIVNPMLSLTNGKEKRVWIIAQTPGGADYFRIRYGIRPCDGSLKLNDGWSISSSTSSLYEGDIWTTQISADDWRNELKEYDYVLLFSICEEFKKDYASLFEKPEDIDDGRIFEIDHETGILVRAY